MRYQMDPVIKPQIYNNKHRSQSGAMLPLFALGLVAIIGLAGLAIDSSHVFVNVTRLQNALDSAALSAAKTLNEPGGTIARATAVGTAAFNDHSQGEFTTSSMAVDFQYSNTLFGAISTNPRFVRASVAAHDVPLWFAQILPGIGTAMPIGTTAVAGPQPLGGGETCDIAPLLMCGDPGDLDSTDGTLFGLPYGDSSPTYCLKSSTNTGGNGNNGNPPAECSDPVDNIGPGNFQLLDLGCEQGGGGSCVRQNLAGGHSSCASVAGTVETKPGGTVGPTAQGFNTRFGMYHGAGVNSVDHPPDLVTDFPLNYQQYEQRYASSSFDNSNGSAARRVMAVPIGDCSPTLNGQSTISVLAIGCYFMTQPTEGTGQDNWIIGHLIEGCEASGSPGDTPSTIGSSLQSFEIILWNDPANPAS